MTMNKPLVSVIMPVYNGEKYIRKAVESVYEQEVSLELLVIDDGSTDHTEEVLSAYEGREDFRYLKNQQNMGAAETEESGWHREPTLLFWMQMTGGSQAS